MHSPIDTGNHESLKEILLGSFRLGAGLLLLLSAVLIAPSASAADTDAENTAFTLYRTRCALCHYIDRAEDKFGPSLKDLFKRQMLRNAKPVNEQNVIEWIANGDANMPAFRYTLDQQEMQLLVSYIKGDFEKRTSKEPAPERGKK